MVGHAKGSSGRPILIDRTEAHISVIMHVHAMPPHSRTLYEKDPVALDRACPCLRMLRAASHD